MSGHAIIRFAERRVENAISAWQLLRAKCEDTQQKLLSLQRHLEGYRNAMRAGLLQGMPAASTAAYIGFIGQIERVIAAQKSQLGDVEEACARQWRELLEVRREKRVWEILRERASARDAVSASRRLQSEVDELLQRAARAAGPAFNEQDTR